MSSILLALVISHGAIVQSSLPEHAQSQGKTLNRVVMGALPRGKHVKPLVSEYGNYINAVIPVQHDTLLQPFLDKLPKGTSVQSRLLSTWGVVRDAIEKQVKKRLLTSKLNQLKGQDANHELFLEQQFLDNIGCREGSNYAVLEDFVDKEAICEKVTVAIPREPVDFLRFSYNWLAAGFKCFSIGGQATQHGRWDLAILVQGHELPCEVQSSGFCS